MKRIISAFLTFIFFLLNDLNAALPSDAIVLEPETMKITGNGWIVRENFTGWFKGRTTGDKCLYGAGKGDGKATATLNCLKDGKYRVWVRYLDLNQKSRKGNNAFVITLKQKLEADKTADGDGIEDLMRDVSDDNAKSLKNKKEFDQFGMRRTAADEQKWGDSYAAFVWDSMEADLKKGAFDLVIEKSHQNATERHQRTVDCIIITQNTNYEPSDTDFHPLYVKFINNAETACPIRLTFRARRTDGSDYWEHVSTQTELWKKPVAPGTQSKWVEISRFLKIGRDGEVNRVTLSAHETKRGDLTNASYKIFFSTSPDDSGIVKTLDRKDAGNSVSFRIDLLEPKAIMDEVEESAENLKRSMAVSAKGKLPVRFTFGTGCAVSSLMDQTIANELQTLKNLGINGISFPPKYADRFLKHGFNNTNIGFYAWSLRGEDKTRSECFLMPKTEKIRAAVVEAEESAKEYPSGIKVRRLAGLADEPGFNYLKHVPECETCIKAFPEYLKEMNVSFDEIKKELLALDKIVDSIDNVRPTSDPKSPILFYWTSRFGISSVTKFIALATKLAREQSSEWGTTLNFANQLRSTMAGSGLDWFEIFNSGAMTEGQNEDYLAWTKCFQIRGYPMAVMRAACRKNKIPYGPLVAYPSNTGWELVCGGFSQLGQGAKCFRFFNYGPHYVPTSSPCSNLQWVHDGTKHITYAAGAVEDVMYDAEVMRGDAALLLSTTSDIWNMRLGREASWGNLFGMERMYLYLILRHLQIRPDILSEEDLAERLSSYKTMFATDSHLHRKFAAEIKKWVQAGGVLYVGANALAFDEYNRPLGLIEEMGIQRPDWEADSDLVPGRPEYELNHRKALTKVKTSAPFDALFAFQTLKGGTAIFSADNGKPALAEVAYGKGKVIAGATFPSMEYAQKSKKDASLEINSSALFSSGPREFIAHVIKSAGITPAASASDFLLEPNLLVNGKNVIVSLANWSGKEQNAELTLRGLGRKAAEIGAVRTKIETKRNTAEEIVISGTFGAGDIIVLNLE